VQPVLSSSVNTYHFLHSFRYHGNVFYRLKIINTNGSFTYSAVIQFPVNTTINSKIAPTIIRNGIINAYLDNAGYRAVEVVSSNGAVVAKQNISGQSGQVKIPVTTLPTGVYIVKFIGDNAMDVEKIVIR
jgi:hypothetical protein